jgi:hypothetical protein
MHIDSLVYLKMRYHLELRLLKGLPISLEHFFLFQFHDISMSYNQNQVSLYGKEVDGSDRFDAPCEGILFSQIKI